MTRFSALRRTPALLLLSGLVIAATPASHAQTPAKPAPKAAAKPAAATPAAAPAAEAKTGTLGGGTGRGKLLMIEELRACMQQQVSMGERRKAFELESAASNAERAALLADQSSLQADTPKVEEARKAITELNTRYNDYAGRMKAYNERAEEARSKQGMAVERELRRLDTERSTLEKLGSTLAAERTALAYTDKLFADYNQRRVLLEERANTWNQTSGTVVARGNKLNEDLETWQNECANRRYREEDEQAIKRGK